MAEIPITPLPIRTTCTEAAFTLFTIGSAKAQASGIKNKERQHIVRNNDNEVLIFKANSF